MLVAKGDLFAELSNDSTNKPIVFLFLFFFFFGGEHTRYIGVQFSLRKEESSLCPCLGGEYGI